MNSLKIILPCIIGYLITGLMIKFFLSLNLNIGSLWINIKYYFVIPLGILLMILLKKQKILNVITLILCVSYLLLIIIDSFDNYKNNSLIIYILIINIYLLASSIYKQRKLTAVVGEL